MEYRTDYSTKQVIVIRKDLKMRRGKEIAQGSHASMGWLVGRFNSHDGMIFAGEHELCLTASEASWLENGTTKITVIVDSEEELIRLRDSATERGIKSYLVTDSGRTEFDGVPTKTALAIGPDWSDEIDKVTGHLKLY